MNDNNLNDTSFSTKYRATKNLNTALEKPEFNVNDTLDINIKDVDNNNFAKNILNNDSKVNYYNDFDINKFRENNITDNNLSNETNSYMNNNLNDSNFTSSNINDNSFIDNNISSNMNDNSFIDNNTSSNMNDNSFNDDDNVNLIGATNNKTNYKPAMEESKKKNSIEFTIELKILVFMCSLIMVFIFLMPYIFDIIQKIKLAILY